MSLRDQLMAKGLVSKKKARRAEQVARKQRRLQQGHAEKKSKRQAAEAAERAAQAQRAEDARLEARRARRGEQEARDHALRLEQLVRGNRLGAQGRHRFFHRTLDRKLGYVDVPEAIARRLRIGQAAIACLDGVGYYVITDKGARKLAELAPELLLHWVTDTQGLSLPEEQLAPVRDWDTSLRPHRLRGG